MDQKREFRAALSLKAWALLGLAVVVWPLYGTLASADTDETPRAARMLETMHQAFASFINSVGGLSPDEQDQVDDLEKAVAGDLKAHPDKMDQPGAMRDEILAKFRAVLTPAHQKTFDKIITDERRRRDSLATSEHLKQIGLALMLYSRDHNDALPADLGTLLSKSLEATDFLAGGATTRPSTAPSEQDAQHLAKWVNQNADFIYLAAGRNFSQLPASFVVAYLKPAAAKEGNTFLLDNGSVVTLDAEQSSPVVAELQAGHNPPPSLQARKVN